MNTDQHVVLSHAIPPETAAFDPLGGLFVRV
jgi:hypothetical protein